VLSVITDLGRDLDRGVADTTPSAPRPCERMSHDWMPWSPLSATAAGPNQPRQRSYTCGN